MRSTVSAAGLISLYTKRSRLRPLALIKAALAPISKGAYERAECLRRLTEMPAGIR